uniref:XRCC1_N domain-containing protein n=1 Tax=Macrostomum lignano TaxID=282301 RepID=A0A1I8H3Y0_9PLAT
MESVVHIFDTDTENRRKLDQIGGGSSSRARCAEFRIIIEQTLDNSGRVKPLMLEFRVSQDRPRMPFLANEASSPASEFAECIRKLAPRLSSRLDRHSSMAGSSTDLTRGPAVSAVSAVASAPAATSAATPAASTEATERHRRANSHAGMAIAAAAVAAEPPLPEQQQQEQELDEQQQPAARPEVEESSDSSSRIADTEAAPESDEPAAASAVSPVSGVQQSVENFQRQSELMREQRVCLTQIVAEEPSTWAAAAGSYYSADLPPPTPVAGDEVSADVATLKRALQAVNSAKDSRFNSSSSGGNANRGDASPDDNNDLSSSLTAPDGSDISGSQTPPPSDFVVVERRAQINPRDASGGSSAAAAAAAAKQRTTEKTMKTARRRAAAAAPAMEPMAAVSSGLPRALQPLHIWSF